MKLKGRIEEDKENIYCFATWVDPKHILDHNPTSKKAQFLPLFNVTLSQLQLNSISTKLRLNLMSISFQPQPQINLSLKLTKTSITTSTQYGCDIKATQSCWYKTHAKVFENVFREDSDRTSDFYSWPKGWVLIFCQANL